MCLGFVMQIESIDGMEARCHAQGIYRQVNLMLLSEGTVSIGDCVLVHVGYAIQKVEREQASTHWALLEQMGRQDA